MRVETDVTKSSPGKGNHRAPCEGCEIGVTVNEAAFF